jgi:hypothetical protein
MVWSRRSIIKEKKGRVGFANVLADGRNEIHYKSQIPVAKIKESAEKNNLEVVKRKNALIFTKNGFEIARLLDYNLLIIKKEADKRVALSLAEDLED